LRKIFGLIYASKKTRHKNGTFIMKTINLFLIILMYFGNSQLINAESFQSSSSIQAAIHKHIEANLPQDSDYKVKLAKIDNRLHLAICKNPLNISTRNDLIKPGRNSIRIACVGTKSWTIYTSVAINVYKDVVVLSHPVRRGDIYTSNSFHLERHDISKLRSGFFNDPKFAIDKQATRNISQGTIITKSNFTEPKLIKRGEKVTIKISSSSIEINMAGIALMDGIRNQNIRVKNIKTHKIVQATVINQGLVVVMF